MGFCTVLILALGPRLNSSVWRFALHQLMTMALRLSAPGFAHHRLAHSSAGGAMATPSTPRCETCTASA